MAIADTDSSKKEAHETSTSDNGAKKMLSDPSTSKLLSVQREYFKIKDFAFNMPGGWDNPTTSIFILTCRKLKGEFLHHDTPADGLKIWQKIVKKCLEELNDNSVFNVNNVIELAQSLKVYVLRNEHRKNEEYFDILYNDVSDLLEYFPSQTIDSNLTMRQRTRSESTEMKITAQSTEVKTTAPHPEPPPTRRILTNRDTLIIKACNEVSELLTNPKTSAKFVWKKVGQHIFKTSGINIDVKKHLSNFKRDTIRELKKVRDDSKRAAMFLDLVSDFKPIFDYMPPRTVRCSDFIVEEDLADSESVKEKVSTDVSKSVVEAKPEDSTLSESAKNGDELIEDSPSPRTLRTSPRLANINEKKSVEVDSEAESEASYSSSEPETPPPPPPRVSNKRKRTRQQEAKSVSHVEAKRTHLEPQQQAGVSKKGGKLLPGVTALSPVGPSVSSSKGKSTEPLEKKSWPKNRLKENVEEISAMDTSQQQSPVKTGKLQEPVIDVEKVDGSSGSPGSFVAVPARLEAVAPMGKPVQPSTAVDKTVPRLVANHHSELPRPNHTPAEADHSQSAGDSDPGPSRVSSDLSQLMKCDANTRRILDNLKQLKDSHGSQALIQVMPRTGLTAQQVAVCDNLQDNQAVLPTNGSQLDTRPPPWFDMLFADYKKHEIWKMNTLFRKQQELVSMEKEKLSFLERILSSLNDRT